MSVNLNFIVNDLQIEFSESETVVADSKNYLKASFTFFGDVWQGNAEKTAIFYNSENAYSVLLENDCCFIPTEVLKSTGFFVGVLCGTKDSSGNAVKAYTLPCRVIVSTSCCQESFSNTGEILSQYDQIIQKITSLENSIDSKCYIPVRGIDYWTNEDISTIQSYIDDKLGDVETLLDEVIAIQSGNGDEIV